MVECVDATVQTRIQGSDLAGQFSIERFDLSGQRSLEVADLSGECAVEAADLGAHHPAEMRRHEGEAAQERSAEHPYERPDLRLIHRHDSIL